jgi:hypothetical protein
MWLALLGVGTFVNIGLIFRPKRTLRLIGNGCARGSSTRD